METVLEVRDLSVAIGSEQILDDVSMVLHRAEILALVGHRTVRARASCCGPYSGSCHTAVKSVGGRVYDPVTSRSASRSTDRYRVRALEGEKS